MHVNINEWVKHFGGLVAPHLEAHLVREDAVKQVLVGE